MVEREKLEGWAEGCVDLVRLIGRLEHTSDGDGHWPEDSDDAVHALDGLIAKARDLMAEMPAGGREAPSPPPDLGEAVAALDEGVLAEALERCWGFTGMPQNVPPTAFNILAWQVLRTIPDVEKDFAEQAAKLKGGGR